MRIPLPAILFTAVLASISTAALAAASSSAFIEPVLGQLVGFTLPSGFEMNKANTSAGQYFRDAFPKGETTKNWSQMITVSGAKDENVTAKSAQFIAAHISDSIQRQCPDTFAVKPLGPTKIDGQDSFVAIASCGKVGPDKHSETALMLVIKAPKAVYTIQWAERTPSSAENLTIDEAKWKGRLKQMVPFRVCPVVAGEKPPYASCGKK
jgi:hypothetical protein